MEVNDLLFIAVHQKN